MLVQRSSATAGSRLSCWRASPRLAEGCDSVWSPVYERIDPQPRQAGCMAATGVGWIAGVLALSPLRADPLPEDARRAALAVDAAGTAQPHARLPQPSLP